MSFGFCCCLFVLLYENINEYSFLIKKIVLGFSKREKIQKVILQKMVPHSLSFFSVTDKRNFRKKGFIVTHSSR